MCHTLNNGRGVRRQTFLDEELRHVTYEGRREQGRSSATRVVGSVDIESLPRAILCPGPLYVFSTSIVFQIGKVLSFVGSGAARALLSAHDNLSKSKRRYHALLLRLLRHQLS
jgi:hypothetical protein